MASQKAIKQLKQMEGKVLHGHMVRGVLHIGIGYNLQNERAAEDLLLAGVPAKDIPEVMKENGKKLTDEQANELFDISLSDAATRAKQFVPNYSKLPQTVRDTLVNMSFQLGNGLNEFDDLREALKKGDFQAASKEMLNSDWAKQTPSRAKTLAAQVNKLESAPKQQSAVVQKLNSQQVMKQQIQDQRVQALANAMDRQTMVKRLADSMAKAQIVEEKPEPTKVQRLEQGLFEDESGKKFVVDDKNRMFQLDEGGKPTKLIDPTTMDFSDLEEANNG